MNTLDLREALTDAILFQAGLKPKSQCHPQMLDALHGEGAVLARTDSAYKELEKGTLRRLVETFGQGRSDLPNAAFAAGLSSSEFTNHLAETARVSILQKLQAQTDHRAFCKKIELKNFLPHEFPTLGVDFELLEATPELNEFSNVIVVGDAPGLTARVHTFGRNLFISRKVIVNDRSKEIFDLVGNAGTAAGRLERRLVYSFLESNPVLADGAPMFHTDFGNKLNGAILSSDSIGAACAALRRMKTVSGIEGDLKPRFLVVAAEAELTARTVVHRSGLELAVIGTASLTLSDNWYLFGDQNLAPVVGLLYLESSTGGLTLGPAGGRDKNFVREGITLGARFDVGVCALGRMGVVRGGYS